ncbi:hypothetical protein TURU_162078 [Turdus rufiventris]|nr:hypothetical protein TURU_162078 [Turdus rufiventris]
MAARADDQSLPEPHTMLMSYPSLTGNTRKEITFGIQRDPQTGHSTSDEVSEVVFNGERLAIKSTEIAQKVKVYLQMYLEFCPTSPKVISGYEIHILIFPLKKRLQEQKVIIEEEIQKCLSKCLHLKLKVPFLEKHSTITSLTFQVNVTLTRKPKQFVLTPETELQHPGPESFPGVDA